MLPILDPVLHQQLRLAVMSLLLARQQADFTYLMNETGATKGNLSVQLRKLEEAGYIGITKKGAGPSSRTTCKITEAGIDAFEAYVNAIDTYVNQARKSGG